jgi:hypothetical protein
MRLELTELVFLGSLQGLNLCHLARSLSQERLLVSSLRALLLLKRLFLRAIVGCLNSKDQFSKRKH